MNRPPEILVDTGYVTDENGVLTEMVIPAVVNTLKSPTKITFLGKTLDYIPSPASVLEEFDAPNIVNLSDTTGTLFNGFSKLTSVRFDSLQTLNKIANSNNAGTFRNCTQLATLYAPNLTTVSMNEGTWNSYFINCTGLISVDLPKLTYAYALANGDYLSLFCYCTGLTDVRLGSVGHAVTKLSTRTFLGCTQSGLTITIYTANGASLSGAPWGATNATIEYEEA